MPSIPKLDFKLFLRDWIFQILFVVAAWLVLTSGAFVISRETYEYFSSHRRLHMALLHGGIAFTALLTWWRWSMDAASFARLEPFASLHRFAQLPAVVSVGILYAAYAAFQWISLIFLHSGFGTSLWDLGFNDQIIWGTAHGQFLTISVRGGFSEFGEHFRPIMALLAPVYWVSNSVNALFFVQCFLIAACIPLVYGIARENRLPHAVSLALAAAVFFYQPMRNGILFPFHPQTFADPFLLAGFYLMLKQKRWLSLLPFLLALLCKENIVLEVFGIGLFFFFRRERFGAVIALLAITILLLNTQVIEPMHRFDYKWNKWGYFEHFTDPSLASWIELGGKLLAPKLFFFLFLVLGPVLFLPLRAPGWVWLLGPTLGVRILNDFPGFRIITAHYTAGLNALIFIAAVYGLARLYDEEGGESDREGIAGFLRRHAAGTLLVVGLLFSGVPDFFHFENLAWEASAPKNQQIGGVLNAVPEDYAVVSTQTFLAQMTHRMHLFGFDTVRENSPYEPIYRNADLLVVDHGRLQTNEKAVLDTYRERGYQTVFDHAPLEILARPYFPADELEALRQKWQTAVEKPDIPYRKKIRFIYKRLLIAGAIGIALWLAVRGYRSAQR